METEDAPKAVDGGEGRGDGDSLDGSLWAHVTELESTNVSLKEKMKRIRGSEKFVEKSEEVVQNLQKALGDTTLAARKQDLMLASCLVWALSCMGNSSGETQVCSHMLIEFIQIMSVIAMFYGIKTIRFWFFLPHFIFRIACIVIICVIDTWLILRATGENVNENNVALLISVISFAVAALCALYATWVEVRCAHFVKRSRETGFSISVPRPVGPATISLSEPQPNAPEPPLQPIRRLPPLRHHQAQYIVNDETLPAPRNPNEAN
ncbi:hypothetical protein GCK72_023256 [Caenorhabditis remanei]|uniref:Uncharacterized protein n=1 Tax=Caenorhabditis remanei TaxID=31234 RepID=A0A6A5FWL8_CAERE|nr:hypothetical protein GCK72_023256 [Caenorhabditis remanei]KAF1746799.1 hypothetical protein GCK72_023256 [Caenorhabditis remanei]